jgi:hypothetical protein
MVYSFAKSGQLESLRIGNSLRFTTAVVADYEQTRDREHQQSVLRRVRAQRFESLERLSARREEKLPGLARVQHPVLRQNLIQVAVTRVREADLGRGNTKKDHL